MACDLAGDGLQVPDAVASSRTQRRAAYVAVSGALLLLTVTVPDTDLYRPGCHNGGGAENGCTPRVSFLRFAAVVLVYVLACGSFHLVQGSDPGYLPSKYDNAVTTTAVPDGDDGDSDDGDDGRSSDGNGGDGPGVALLVPGRRWEGAHARMADYRPGGLVSEKEEEEEEEVDPPAVDAAAHGGRPATRQRRAPGRDTGASYADASTAVVYCKWCEATVPLRSHHCRACRRCVATFDHHCGVIGTCIGEKNHCRFVAFLWLNFAGVWYYGVLVDSAFANVTALQQYQQQQYLRGSPPIPLGTGQRQPAEIAYVASIALGLLWWYLLLLVAYQVALVATGTTGYECIKGPDEHSHEMCDMPYGSSVWGNVRTFCCERDGLLLALKARLGCGNVSRPWQPYPWPAPHPKPDIRTVEVRDNWCRNKHYSCC